MGTVSDMPPQIYADLQRICLALPEAVEKETWGHPTFRVRDKMFASCGVSEDSAGRARVTMALKAEPGEQESLLALGYPFFYPKYVGNKGWIGIHLTAETDWVEIAELVEESYRAIAPKRLVHALETSEMGS